jgi:hypothetical protein
MNNATFSFLFFFFLTSASPFLQVVLQPKSKNEVAIETQTVDTANVDDEQLCEIRLYIPGKAEADEDTPAHVRIDYVVSPLLTRVKVFFLSPLTNFVIHLLLKQK